MRKPSISSGPAASHAASTERIVEISDNNGRGLGALMSVFYHDHDPALAGGPSLTVHIYRQDAAVLVSVEGHHLTPMEDTPDYTLTRERLAELLERAACAGMRAQGESTMGAPASIARNIIADLS